MMSAATIENWINKPINFLLRHWVAAASVWAGLIVAGAVLIPILEANGYTTLSWLGYSIYRVICPQRPDHSWFIAGYKMGFEQRDTAMFVTASLACPLWVIIKNFGFKGINGKTVVLMQIPMLIDVGTQMIGMRDSDGFWRSLTGAISVLGIAGWILPRIDADFRRARERSSRESLSPESPEPVRQSVS